MKVLFYLSCYLLLTTISLTYADQDTLGPQQDTTNNDTKKTESSSDDEKTPQGHYLELPFTWGGVNNDIRLCSQACENNDIARMNRGEEKNCWVGTMSLIQDSSHQVVPSTTQSGVTFYYPSSRRREAHFYPASTGGFNPQDRKYWQKKYGMTKWGGADVNAWDDLAGDVLSDDIDEEFWKKWAQDELDRYNTQMGRSKDGVTMGKLKEAALQQWVQNEALRRNSAKDSVAKAGETPSEEYYRRNLEDVRTLDEQITKNDTVADMKKDADLTMIEGAFSLKLGLIASGMYKFGTISNKYDRFIENKLWDQKEAKKSSNLWVMLNPWMSFVFGAGDSEKEEKKSQIHAGDFVVVGGPTVLELKLKDKTQNASYGDNQNLVRLCSLPESSSSSGSSTTEGSGKVDAKSYVPIGHAQYCLFIENYAGAALVGDSTGKRWRAGGRCWEIVIEPEDMAPGANYIRISQYPTRSLAQGAKWLMDNKMVKAYRKEIAKAIVASVFERHREVELIRASYKENKKE